MNEKNTKWINEISVKYNDIIENYKNIEMFENIYNTTDESNNKREIDSSNIQEGFKIFDDFDIHKKPKNGYRSIGTGPFFELLNAIKEYILCPFYKSDELIDNAIQVLLDLFLKVKCDNKNTEDSEYEDVQILDLSDVIQPDLLYREEFQNNNKTSQSDACKNKKEKTKKDSKRYKKIIKNELYKILCIPLVVHILYNIYFLFLFKDTMGVQAEFVDVEKKYYDPYLKQIFSYFLDIIIKPITYLYWIFDYISKNENLHIYSDKYPYVFFISIYISIYLYISSYDKSVIAIIGDLLTLKTVPTSIYTFCSAIIIWEFFSDMTNKNTVKEWKPIFTVNTMIGLIQYLIYWFLRACFTFLLTSFSALLCVYYMVIYMLFGIQFSQSKDTFDVYSDIDDSIYQKIYKIFNADCDPFNLLKIIVQFISKYSFIYLVEITIFLILGFGFYNYRSINDANLLSFLYILHFTGIFILFIWSFAKYNSFVKSLDAKFGLSKT